MTLRTPALDHLVVVARTLDEGVAWCEATLGITPGPGGEHPLFGTHNRLFSIGSAAFPGAYFEIIAINSVAIKQGNSQAKRWFDMDSPVLQAQIAAYGPQLAHWVARVPDAAASTAQLAALGLDRGSVLAASRETPQGLLQWQITVRDDGQRLLDGSLPTVIQWGDVHPTDRMTDSGITLQSFALQHPQADLLQRATTALGVPVSVQPSPAHIKATLQTPRGLVTLASPGA